MLCNLSHVLCLGLSTLLEQTEFLHLLDEVTTELPDSRHQSPPPQQLIQCFCLESIRKQKNALVETYQ